MLLGTAEEWKLINQTARPAPLAAHPFHIHVNPFQVIEVFDPNDPVEQGPNCHKLEDPSTWKSCKPALNPPYVWRDTIPIPVARDIPHNDPNKKRTIIPGYVRIRTRFDDFPGQFVIHCHILAHEDHGMMQLIQVVPSDPGFLRELLHALPPKDFESLSSAEKYTVAVQMAPWDR